MPAAATKTMLKLCGFGAVAFGAVALSHQAGAQPATPAAAATPAAPATAGVPTAPADIAAKGRELFSNWSCGSCHTLSDAGAEGHVGPSLDGDPNLSEALVVSRVTNGQGAMPAFGGQMTDQEIATIAKYVKQAAVPAK